MADRFDKFTDRARRVLTFAQEEAQRFNHSTIGPEHLLLGLVREEGGVAAKVLENLGVELKKLRSAIEFIIGRGERATLGEIGLTAAGKETIRLSVVEAKNLDHHYIGTEHILLGLLAFPEDSVAKGALEAFGISFDRVRTETLRILEQSMPQTQSSGLSEIQRQIDKANELTVASLERFGLEGDRHAKERVAIISRRLARIINVRFLRFKVHRHLVSLLSELIELTEDYDWGFAKEDRARGMEWINYVVWEVWLPIIKEALEITPEEAALAESQFSEAVARLK